MASTILQFVSFAGAPEFRPDQNEQRPWAVDYRDGVHFDGSQSFVGTLYFEESWMAVSWRAAVLLSQPGPDF